LHEEVLAGKKHLTVASSVERNGNLFMFRFFPITLNSYHSFNKLIKIVSALSKYLAKHSPKC
jgi:hypothetical protein